MGGAIPPLPQYAFMAWCLVKAQDNFTFYLLLHDHNTEIKSLILDSSKWATNLVAYGCLSDLFFLWIV